MESKVKNLPEIILCGYERGGTTMLSELFRSNNYESGFECGVLMCKQPYDFVNYQPYFNMMINGWNIELPLLKKACNGNFKVFYTQLVDKSAISFHDRRVFDKTPIYMRNLGRALYRTEFINKACVIHRDPRSVFVSWAKRVKEKNQSIESCIEVNMNNFCDRYVSYFIGSIAHINNPNVLFIPFEEMTTREDLYYKTIGMFAIGHPFSKRSSESRFENVSGKNMDLSKVLEYKKHLGNEIQERILNKTRLASIFFANVDDREKYGQYWINVSSQINDLLDHFNITYLYKDINGTYFEPFTYLLRYNDLLKAKVNPEMHFRNYGIREGRAGS